MKIKSSDNLTGEYSAGQFIEFDLHDGAGWEKNILIFKTACKVSLESKGTPHCAGTYEIFGDCSIVDRSVFYGSINIEGLRAAFLEHIQTADAWMLARAAGNHRPGLSGFLPEFSPLFKRGT